MNPQRALAPLQRQSALPLPNQERAVTLAAAMLLEIYLTPARRSLDLGGADAKAPGAASDRESGAHEQQLTSCVAPPFCNPDDRPRGAVRAKGAGNLMVSRIDYFSPAN